MKVYRVARRDDDRTGPYNFQDWASDPMLQEMLWQHAPIDGSHHRAPHRDDLLQGIDTNEFCALDSLDNLYAWFKGFVKALGNSGFVIYVYETDTARVGWDGQTVFILDGAALVETLEMV